MPDDVVTRLPLPLKELLHRIEAKTAKTASCWFWQGAVFSTSKGAQQRYPRLEVSVDRVRYPLNVRRLIYEAVHGPLLPGEHVSTICQISLCVRDDHLCKLAPGTPPAWRRTTRGRFTATIPAETVQRAVRLYYAGYSQDAIARQCGVSQTSVSHLVCGTQRRRETGLPRRSGASFIARRGHPGETHPDAKTTWQEVLVIHGLYRAGYTMKPIAANFDLRLGGVQSILYAKSSRFITAVLPPARRYRPRRSTGDVVASDLEPRPDEAMVWKHWQGGSHAQ